MHANGLHISETFSREQTESDVCEACLDELNTLQEEIDFYRSLLRKNKITIPDGPYDQKQNGY